MTVRESVPLSTLTTFKTGGLARYVIECENESEIREALAFAKEKNLPWYVIGEGSNLLAPHEGYKGVIIRAQLTRVSFEAQDGDALVTAEAGVPWDALVREAGVRELWGIENLAGIPGLVGGAPVQNIGAYGSELSQVLAWVEALDPATGETKRFSNEECKFSYRESRFKHEPLILLRIALVLKKQSTPQLSYTDLARKVEEGEILNTPVTIADAVRSIRSKKFPDIRVAGTAGSFFKNPIVSIEAAEALTAKYPGIPTFPVEGGVKVSLAWILDKVLGLRGFSRAGVRLFEAQPLVIVAEEGATTDDIESLARETAARVKEATKIELEREVRSIK